MKRRVLILAALTWFAATVRPVAAQAPAGDLAPYAARALAPGVHLLATPPDYVADVTSNIVVIEQSDGLVVIDSGRMAADGRRVVGYARLISQLPIKAVVFTHWHHDHPGGASEIRAAWPQVRIISTTRTLEAMRGPALRHIGLAPEERFENALRDERQGLISYLDEQLRSDTHDAATRQRYERTRADALARLADIPGTHFVLPTETFREELFLDDPVRPVRLMFLGRANTEGDAIAWLPNERIVMTGDVVVSPVPFGFFSFPGDWVAVLERVKALNYSLLVPGHGEPQTDTAYVDSLIASISDFRRQAACEREPHQRRSAQPHGLPAASRRVRRHASPSPPTRSVLVADHACQCLPRSSRRVVRAGGRDPLRVRMGLAAGGVAGIGTC